MPMFIPCIDDYFSQKQRDLYFVVFGEGRDWRISPFEHNQIMANPAGREELLAWFAEHLPETEIKPLFTFGWNYGFISTPYDGTVSIDFDERSLAVYCSRWESEDGDSIDPRFQCHWMRFSDYLKNHGGVLPEKPSYEE